MQRTAVLNIVGLTPRLITAALTPRIHAFMERHALARIQPVIPAVTSTAQSTYLTGKLPRDHGIVANGWYDRDYAEHRFWKQSNHLVTAPKLWETLRRADPEFTCAKVFWWFNMHSTADYAITPRPLYPADGSKVFDIHTQPMGMRDRLKKDLGKFPFPHFWGPASSIKSSRWIAASARWIEEKHWPSLSLVYLPHLDYDLQRHGPDHPTSHQALRDIDQLTGELLDFYAARHVKVILLSEYGITPVDRPVHLNRIFREQGWLSIKDELGRETLDLGGSQVICIPDHQLAHIYLNEPALLDQVAHVLRSIPGVEVILGRQEKYLIGLDHPRSGDLIAVSDFRSWFTYCYWQDDRRAPDFARTVDIHRKPGYDPCELLLDPQIRFPKLKIARKLLLKTCRIRTLFDVIPLDATLIKGSHGRLPEDSADWPLIIGDLPNLPRSATLQAHQVHDHLLEHCARGSGYRHVGR